MATWHLQSGEVVKIYRPLPQVESLLAEALSRIDASGRRFFVETVNFGRPIGETTLVRTCPDDEIIYAQRPGRSGLTRFVKDRTPESCTTLVVVLKRVATDEDYVLVDAFVGIRAEPEPWDEQSFRAAADPIKAREESKNFWSSHAVVWEAQ